MKSILDIQLQKLFLITLVLKVGSSFLGWYFQLQWSLGFSVPLVIMAIYIVLGYNRRDTDVTDEKFADTCYYLGFIFTITSIIFSLFDLPYIGTKIQDIAVRFGAAMVSTVLGLGVRVYLVSFKQEVSDAILEAEEAVLEATRKFSEQLKIALERLQDFESQVDTAAKSSVERVNLQIENLSKNHADKLTGFFVDLTTLNQKAFTLALAEVKTASRHLSDSVDGYSMGMRSNLTSIEAKVGAFAEAVTDRLKTTTFPDDYFAKRLETPLNQLNESANLLAGGVKLVSSEVGESSVAISRALKKLTSKADATESSLETVLRLTEQQQAVLEAAQGQLTTMGRLATTLANVDTALTSSVAGIGASNAVTAELTTRVSSVLEEGVAARRSLEDTLAEVISKLDSNATATTSVASKIDSNTTATLAAAATFAETMNAHSVAAREAAKTIATKLEDNATATNYVTTSLSAAAAASELVASKLDGVVTADMEASATLSALGHKASTAINKVDLAVEQLQGMVRQFSALDAALRAQSFELKQVAEQIKNVKVVVEMPSPAPAHTYALPLHTLDVSAGVPNHLHADTHAAASLENQFVQSVMNPLSAPASIV